MHEKYLSTSKSININVNQVALKALKNQWRRISDFQDEYHFNLSPST